MAETNKMLAEHNTLLCFTFGTPSRTVLATMQVKTGRGQKKASAVVANFCPFCGEAYVKDTPTLAPENEKWAKAVQDGDTE